MKSLLKMQIQNEVKSLSESELENLLADIRYRKAKKRDLARKRKKIIMESRR